MKTLGYLHMRGEPASESSMVSIVVVGFGGINFWLIIVRLFVALRVYNLTLFKFKTLKNLSRFSNFHFFY